MTHSQSTCSGTVGHYVQKGVGRAWLYLYITLSSLNVFYNHCSLKRGLDLAPLLRLVADRTGARWVRRDLCLHWRVQTVPRLPLPAACPPPRAALCLVLSQVCLSSHAKIESLLCAPWAWGLGDIPWATCSTILHFCVRVPQPTGAQAFCGQLPCLLTFLSPGPCAYLVNGNHP